MSDTLTQDTPASTPTEPVQAADANALTNEMSATSDASEQAEDASQDDHESESAKRLAKMNIEARESRRRTRALEKEIEVLRGQRQEQPNEELDRRVEQKAREIAEANAFNARCNDIFEDGVKQFGKEAFTASITELNQTMGALPIALIEAAEDAGAPAMLLHYLGENTDEAERLAAMTPHKMGVAMAVLATKLARKPSKPVSKAPPPIKTVNGSAGGEVDPMKLSMADYAKLRNEQAHARGRR